MRADEEKPKIVLESMQATGDFFDGVGHNVALTFADHAYFKNRSPIGKEPACCPYRKLNLTSS